MIRFSMKNVFRDWLVYVKLPISQVRFWLAKTSKFQKADFNLLRLGKKRLTQPTTQHQHFMEEVAQTSPPRQFHLAHFAHHAQFQFCLRPSKLRYLRGYPTSYGWSSRSIMLLPVNRFHRVGSSDGRTPWKKFKLFIYHVKNLHFMGKWIP